MKSSIPAGAQKVFQGKIFTVYQWQQTLYDGSLATFERLTRADSAGVLPVTSDGKILLSQQEQPATEPFWGLLGGVVDQGETPEQAAQRELFEEAGAIGDHWLRWFSVQPHTKIIWNIHVFIVHNVQITASPKLEPGEKIMVHAVTFAEFIEIAQRPDFRDTEITFAVLQALTNQRKMEELKQLLFG